MLLRFEYGGKERLAKAPKAGPVFLQISPEFGPRSFKPAKMMNIRDASWGDKLFTWVRQWWG